MVMVLEVSYLITVCGEGDVLIVMMMMMMVLKVVLGAVVLKVMCRFNGDQLADVANSLVCC